MTSQQRYLALTRECISRRILATAMMGAPSAGCRGTGHGMQPLGTRLSWRWQPSWPWHGYSG